MRQQVRRRFWVEAALAAISLALFVVTLISDGWIEFVFDVSPDGGSGALEWALVAVAAGLAASFLMLARFEWRRASRQATNATEAA
jgi:hypothetical protein